MVVTPPRGVRVAVVTLGALLASVGCTGEGAAPIEGPTPITQPTAGEGWRLLDEARDVGEAYRTGIATTPDQLNDLRSISGLAADGAEIDWDSEVVVWFGAVFGTSCPIRLTAVEVSDGVLHGTFPLASGRTEGECTADARPHAFLVAVERDLLPERPFSIQLGPTPPPSGVRDQITVVDEDLTVPGATIG